MITRIPLAVLLFLPSVLSAQSPTGFSVVNIDRTADPCTDFYQYACGNWRAQNPIPADQTNWSRFNELAERNRAILRSILAKSASAGGEQIGDLYASCMDESTIQRKGLEPLQPELTRLRALTAKTGLRDEIIRLHRVGVSVFFNFDSGPDFTDSVRNIAQAGQDGLGLPDRDYYFKTDEKSVQLRAQYVAHIAKMLRLTGETEVQATANAKTVLAVETDLAKGSLETEARRDTNKTLHRMTEHELFSLAPFMDWPKYFQGMGAPPVEAINVESPTYFRTVESTVVQHSVEDLRTYMIWQYVSHQAPWLTSPFVNENFAFYGTVLTGAKELRPRWKRCVELVDGDLGDALGHKYVDETFGEQGKKRTLKMVEEIEKALANDIAQLPWMTPTTKQQAREKLDGIRNKIGYPDHWRDYSSVKISRDDLLGNDMRATEFEVQRRMNKIGKPVDKTEWGATPPTVNAYYSPLENNINFPAGILQPPFYDNTMDDAVNYGAIGAVVGHEITHGFDDQGRHFDAKGNLRDWWTPEDAKQFEQRADCFVKEYAAFSPVSGVNLNGRLTLGENTADNGGLRLSFMALLESMKGHPAPVNIDGFTPSQRLFLGWGQIWCENTRPEMSALMARVNPHSPGRFRVNGVLSNMLEFQEAFACKAGQPMVKRPACRVW